MFSWMLSMWRSSDTVSRVYLAIAVITLSLLVAYFATWITVTITR